ncbi:hypothetical protein HNP52_000353 [Sphingomonas kyeonggiensis]|uniref:Uncharacterized protein n=1 Tax=Sphingomonas kyeonggiensis TaxID=1268553 RepID=A0A7W7NR04_9SPHN|nr:hypothetical protein [Sphingomonas kyeonggiensis]MBB4837302.1 hypothetical protein [Sphingomonas kyeonggiensis]
MIATQLAALLVGVLTQVSAGAPSPKMLARDPVMTLTSGQSPDAVQQCVGLALDGIGRPLASREPGKRFVTFGNIETSPVLITIYEETPTRIEVRRSFALNKKWRNRIRFCAS